MILDHKTHDSRDLCNQVSGNGEFVGGRDGVVGIEEVILI